MGDSESDVGATPVIGRVAVGVCAAANLTILGAIITDAVSSSASAVLSGTAQSGPLGLLAFGLHASIILGLIFAVNSLTGPTPDYGKILSLFRRNDLKGLSEAAPAMPLLSFSFLTYWLGFMGVSWFAWRRHEPASAMAEGSAALTLVGAAGLALWLIQVALGKRSPHSAGNGAQEHGAVLLANTLSRPGSRRPIEPYRSNVGIEYQAIRATIPLVELSATSEELHFRFRFGLGLIFGPWHFRREQVSEVLTTRRLFSTRIHIRGEGFEIYVYASPPEPLLLTLEELGYPVDWIMRR
ncbi:hypothetical protein [Arthrobacter sp. FW306-2-2C-D06B]|uniref:hypothetical protein n=1 Tax=Arthrobacter sp. FW306-2-2C-D06B TaxID=2879618 RepID=UPI001F1C89F7|nr:hypothetical protein [Arthrobacter sp. FW306-2-2C-D06B]UKA59813.1 hypothetical protein LFT47_05565 [Arthrobacter sp. FW306-2-2C-D06B]